jgi:hypothetical protein
MIKHAYISRHLQPDEEENKSQMYHLAIHTVTCISDYRRGSDW